MYTFFVKRPVYNPVNRTQVFRSWKPGSANTLIGQRIGRFQFSREISSNDISSLYQGFDIEDDTAVVIKLFSPEISQDSFFASQFKDGMRQAKTIIGEGVAALHDAGMTTRGQLYVVSDYVNGISLHDWVHTSDPQPDQPRRFVEAVQQQQEIAAQRDPVNTVMSLRFAQQMAQMLALFEAHNFAHQTLSLTRFMVQADDVLLVLGCGQPPTPVKYKKHGRFYSLDYASPEQKAGASPTIQSNIYSLGVMLYELLSGSLPLIQEKRRPDARALETTSRVELGDIKPGLSAETYALVNDCLQGHPWNRFSTTAELSTAVASALTVETAAAGSLLNEQTTQAAPIVLTDTAVATPAQPEIKPVKPIRTSPPKAKKPPPTAAEILAKAALLPQVDEYEEEDERSLLVYILPLVGVLLFLIAGGIFFLNRSSDEATEPAAASIAAVSVDGNAAEPQTVGNESTSATPTLEIITPARNSDYLLSDQIIFEVRWPQPLAENAQLRINLQENTYGGGEIIGALNASDDATLYELTIPVSEVSQVVRTFWWQVLLDADGGGPQLGVPLSELRPFNIVSLTATPTRPPAIPEATATPSITPTPVIACIPNPDWIPYTVRANDTLFALAQQTGVSTEAVIEANCLQTPVVLSINQTLLLPRRVSTPTPTATATRLVTATPTATPTVFQPAPAPSEPTDTPVPLPTATIPPIETNPPVPTNPPAPTNPPPGGPTATIPPPPTAVPPTNTPVPPPPTAVPPTNTPVPPPNTPEPTSQPTEPTATPDTGS